MDIKPDIAKLKGNWLPKIICAVIALFVYLFYETQSLERRSFVVPLTVKAAGVMTNADMLPASVRVTLRGKAQDIAAVSERDFTAFVDFTPYTSEGTYQVPVRLSNESDLLAIDPLEAEIRPGTVSTALEKKQSAFVPVKAPLYGTPRYGYTQGEVTVVPEEVKISGPRSMVRAVTEIYTADISVAGRTEPFSVTAPLVNSNPFIAMPEAGEADVYVKINPAEALVSFTLPVPVANLAFPLYPAAGEEAAVEVTVSGAQLDLAAITASDFSARADADGITEPGVYDLPVNITLPPKVFLETQSAQTITITLEERH